MIEIIPAMDLIGGRCVRLTQGDFSRSTVYSDDPLETAKGFEAAGLSRLHMVDLDGARSDSPVNLGVLERVAAGTSLIIDFGGGIRSEADVSAVFDAGAAIVNIGSLAAREPKTFMRFIERFGGERILLGADAKDGKVAISGWQEDFGEPIVAYLQNFAAKGITRAFVTDVASDGAMLGPAVGLYRSIIAAVPSIELIASGGVRSAADIAELERIGCSGVIVGKAIYEQTLTLKELSNYAG